MVLADLLGKLCFLPKTAEPDLQPDNSAASIMVLNWNGQHFLENLWPSLRTAVQEHGGDHEIILVDNGSDDGSVAFTREHYPEIKIVQHKSNLKFVAGYNLALPAASKDILVLLNNDMVVHPQFLTELLAGFRDDKTFAVSAKIAFADSSKRQEETGLTSGHVSHGLLKLRHDPISEHCQDLIPVLWAGGGSSAFDRRKFLALGGFEALFDPFYYEDSSLSYEAWKRGWSVLLAPTAKVVHEHRGTSSTKFSADYIHRINRRNQYLFGWRHLRSANHLLTTTLGLPLNFMRVTLGQRGSSLWHRALLEIRALSSTAPRLPRALWSRQQSRRHARRSDAQIFSVSQSPHLWNRQQQSATSKDKLKLLMLMGRIPKQNVDGSWIQFQLLRTLSQKHQVHVLALLEDESERHHADALAPMVQRLEVMVINKEPGHTDLYHQIPARLRKDYSAPLLQQRLANLLRTEDFDILQVDYLEMAHLLGPQVRALRSLHVCHEPLFLALRRQQPLGLTNSVERWLQYIQAVNYESRIYGFYQHLVCLSPTDRDSITRWLPKQPSTVIPSGVDLDSIQSCSPSTGERILFVGYYGHPPNVEGALWFVRRVLPLIRRQVANATLDLVGKSAPHEVQVLGKEAGVTFHGYVEDLQPYLQQSALSVAPLREGGGLRGKVLEAFAHSRTMVATSVAVAGIAVKDGEQLRIAEDEQQFAQAVVDLLQNQERRQRMEASARELVQSAYTKEHAAAKYEALYQDLLNEAGGKA